MRVVTLSDLSDIFVEPEYQRPSIAVLHVDKAWYSPAGASYESVWALMDDEERKRANGYPLWRRVPFMLSRAAIRTLLAVAAGVSADEIVIVPGSNRKPALGVPHVSLKFNLSHSGTCIAIAVSRCDEIGIDIERIDETHPLALRRGNGVTSPQEAEFIASMAPQYLAKAFLHIWTKKEAIFKCGLANSYARLASIDTMSSGIPCVDIPLQNYALSICGNIRDGFTLVEASWEKCRI
jgi:4'-phosphopantetheinyl transferase